MSSKLNGSEDNTSSQLSTVPSTSDQAHQVERRTNSMQLGKLLVDPLHILRVSTLIDFVVSSSFLRLDLLTLLHNLGGLWTDKDAVEEPGDETETDRDNCSIERRRSGNGIDGIEW